MTKNKLIKNDKVIFPLSDAANCEYLFGKYGKQVNKTLGKKPSEKYTITSKGTDKKPFVLTKNKKNN